MGSRFIGYAKFRKSRWFCPRSVLDLLKRNVIGFVERRLATAQYRPIHAQGLLFYGPPGTGKTHTIHYLTRALPGHTTLIITAEQVGLPRALYDAGALLQPTIVVMEDVDLIARNREQMDSAAKVLLNKLLNHMDGLNETADILFILTTNRPEMLEPAAAAVPDGLTGRLNFLA
ncbi:MAG: ATP-binding protein [Planctomycetaceae bacterium]